MLHGPREWQEGMCEGAGKTVGGGWAAGRPKVGQGDFRPPVRISRILYHISKGLEKGLSI